MGPTVRKLALTAHVATSVGWLGAVLAFLALAVGALVTQDVATMEGAYLAMEVMTWSMLVPLSLASLLSGLVQALGTPWGLLKHYWVLVKLLITLLSTAILLLYTETIDVLADTARDSTPSVSDVALPNASPALHAGGAVVVLLMAVVLSIYKPRGMTRYGQRRASRLRPAP